MSEQKTMSIPPKENFNLTKLNISSKKGVNIHYDVSRIVGESVFNEKIHIESQETPHPDMLRLLKSLRPMMARIIKQTAFKSVLESPEFKATAKQKEFGETYAEKLLEDIEIRGFSLNGSGDNNGVVITSVFTVGNGQAISINSHNIKLSVETYGFEDVLESVLMDVESEVYDFLFNGKKAQLELFDASGNGTVKEEENLFSGTEDEESEETETTEDSDEENEDIDSEDFTEDEDY